LLSMFVLTFMSCSFRRIVLSLVILLSYLLLFAVQI
jgi:hypothetical protein